MVPAADPSVPQAVLVPAVALLGLLVGSFLNVVVWRVPRGLSVVRPPSACPGCGAPVRPRDNVPVVSWLLLRGRCRDCRRPVSVRYPLVEAGTAVAFGAVAAWVGASWALPALLHLAAVSIVLALVDLDLHRLPDAIVGPASVVGVVLVALACLAPGGQGDLAPLVRGLVGAAVLLGLYLVIWLVAPGGMGLGDVKLAGVLGLHLAWAGWGALVVGGFAAFVLGGAFGALLLLSRRADRRTGIPFGPWMLAGAWVGLVAGPSLWSGYLGLL
nr:A24 family peptidase [Cellulomonas marina]